MPYLDCPHCHTSFRVGPLYNEHESCPRCGAPIASGRIPLRSQITRKVRRRGPVEPAVDWESITGSQYAARERVRRPD
jgi:hypothetical protein